ncbi:cutinase family protein [Nocardia sp. XZ_19_385]|uniref:cutinase family protein n=1 Tax=Nocardia sp. XZ_19_385 TaxID=2769488 RepID=UPI00188FAA4D|nr:cutinase family protein [Nocardia sp. XZ_19_385]
MRGQLQYPISLRRLAGVAVAALAVAGVPAATANADNSGGCDDLRVISIRGTFEPQLGSLLLTPLAMRVAQENGGRVTELPYPANRDPDSAIRGAESLTNLLNTAAATCPGQQLVVLGYSQGARVAGEVLSSRLSDKAAAQISAVALFGNPNFNNAEPYNRGTFDPALTGLQPRPTGALAQFADRLRDYCSAGDLVCNGGDPAAGFSNALTYGHVAYFVNDTRDQAAAFIQDRLRSH